MPDAADRPPPPIPAPRSLRARRERAQTGRACELGPRTTQAMVGVGRRDARLMLVGAQPGDREDIKGRPFVGPAGKILERGLERAEISDRLAARGAFGSGHAVSRSDEPRGARPPGAT
ncbi:MAG: uracil-DNA glycosylase family protein [Solirubrobacteraceae bacterium]